MYGFPLEIVYIGVYWNILGVIGGDWWICLVECSVLGIYGIYIGKCAFFSSGLFFYYCLIYILYIYTLYI
jgi:hypothetical protein